MSIWQNLITSRAGYITCRAQCKVKLWDPLFKQKKVQLKVLKYKLFYFSYLIICKTLE